MTTCKSRPFPQNKVEIPVGCAFSLGHRPSVVRGSFSQNVGELVGHRSSKPFFRIGLRSFRVFDQDALFLVVDLALVDASLMESAPEMNQDLEDGGHPGSIFLIRKCFPSLLNLSVGQLLLFLTCRKLNACQSNGVLVCILPSDRLTHQKGEMLDLKSGGVVCDPLPFSPGHVVVGMFVAKLARVFDFFFGEEGTQIQPHFFITARAVFVAIMSAGVIRHPHGEVFSVINGAGLLVGRALRGLLASLQSGFWVIDAQFQVLLTPLSRLKITETEKPKRRARNLAEISHRKRVPYCSPQRKRVFAG